MSINSARLVAILFFILSSCTNEKKENLNCNDLRSGEYEYRGGFSDRVISITRYDSIQVEKDIASGLAMKFAIKWTGPCEYELSPLSFNYNNGKDSLFDRSFTLWGMVRTSIKKITPGYYICESFIERNNTTRVDTMVIMKKIGGFKSVGETFK